MPSEVDTSGPVKAVTALGFSAEADADGWHRRSSLPIGRYDDQFRGMRFRREGNRVRMRFDPEPAISNMNGVVHGAYLMGVVDYALFLAPVALGVARVLGGSTIDASTQFYAPARIDSPVDIVAEVMRETGRMVFTRGVIEQAGEAIGGFSGTVRRTSSADETARIAALVPRPR